LTQLFSGHGCFGTYLHRIKKEVNRRCHHCGADVDDARHTMFECSSWDVERSEVARVLGVFDITTMAEKMVTHADCWEAISTFASRVMTSKEDSERERRGEIPRVGAAT